ncbi:MAG: GGDEF domain-containing protein [Bacteroidota bacterium]
MCCQHSLFFIPALAALLAIILLLINKLKYYFRLSETDELTSLPNYRSFRRKLKKALLIHKKNDTAISVAILDIDGFRRFNNHSYALGDKVLQDFVVSLKGDLPENAFMARFRLGDEFVLILPYPMAKATEKLNGIAEKSKSRIHKNKTHKMEYSLSFSFGVAGFEKGKDSVESLLEKAEQALKENKKLKSNP